MGLFTRIHPATSQFASTWLMFRKTMPKPSEFAFDKSVLFRHFSSCSLTSSSSCFTSCQAQNQKSVYKHTSNDVERMTEPQYRWTLNVKGVTDGKFYFQQIDFMMITLFPSRYFHLSLSHTCSIPFHAAIVALDLFSIIFYPVESMDVFVSSVQIKVIIETSTEKMTEKCTRATKQKCKIKRNSTQNDCIWDVAKAHAHTLISYYERLFTFSVLLKTYSIHIQSSRVI